MEPQKFSLRYKILLILTLIPIVALGVYGFLAVKVFREDKIAYVFDTSRNISASLATQVKTQLNAVLNSSGSLFQDFLFQGSFTGTSQKLFEGEVQIDAIGAYKKASSESQFSLVGHLEKSEGLYESIWAEWRGEQDKIFAEALEKKRLVRKRPQDERLFLVESVKVPNRSEIYVFVLVYRASEAKEVFAENRGMTAFLVGGQGKVFFGPDGMEGRRLADQIPAGFLTSTQSQVSQGAETVRDISKRDLLVAYSKVGFADLMVVTAVDQRQATSATQILVRKSVIFFLVMISLVVIISLLISTSMTEALTSLYQATQRVAEGKFDFKVNVKSNDEIGILARNFNLMAAEVSRLLDQTAEKARMENELLTAKTVQETLFPKNKNRIGHLGIAGFYEPSSECGGDWWHYSEVGERVLFWIGDATGHGAPAALITSAAKSAATIIELLDVTPGQALELLNRCIYDVSKGQIMMTFFLAGYNRNTSELVYANASHEAPFLLKNLGRDLKKNDLISLNEVISPRLGQDRETKYAETKVILDPGDLIFFYTDGVQDIQNRDHKPWGEREFVKTLLRVSQDHPNAEEAVSRFVSAFQAYRMGSSLIDDVTFFAVKNEGPQKEKDHGKI